MTWVNGPIVVGAGPAGLAVAACLDTHGVPSVVLERDDCIASLWQRRTYDRLRLHLPKQFCELPGMPFPADFPEYPSKHQFLSYLHSYAARFHVAPRFNRAVVSAQFDHAAGLWRVHTETSSSSSPATAEEEYIGRWLVVATGENAERIIPPEYSSSGSSGFSGPVSHVSEYKSGAPYAGKKVLVVGCGNSGMEVSLDLCDHGASPSMVVRDAVHVLPREFLGKSTFELATFLMAWCVPLWFVDKVMVFLSWLVLGNLARFGIRRPAVGPLTLKNTHGRTPVLDTGAMARIKSGDITVVPGVARFTKAGAELSNGTEIDVDAVVMATGYKSNVPRWLESGLFGKDGYPTTAFPNGWKLGESGLYSVGFTRRGLSGASADAVRIAGDIGKVWKEENKPTQRAAGAGHRRSISVIF